MMENRIRPIADEREMRIVGRRGKALAGREEADLVRWVEVGRMVLWGIREFRKIVK